MFTLSILLNKAFIVSIVVKFLICQHVHHIYTYQSSTCDVIFHIQHVTEGVVVLEHVQIKRRGIFPYLGPDAVVWRSPAPSQDVVIPLGEMDQLSQGVVETTVESNHQLELWVRVEVHLSVGCVLHLGDINRVSLLSVILSSSSDGKVRVSNRPASLKLIRN